MSHHLPNFALRLAVTDEEVRAAQSLRHEVFVKEMGALGGDLTDPVAGIEADRFDAQSEHLLLLDPLRSGAVVGTTRVMTEEGADRAGRFATEEEFDISPLRLSGRRLLEVGRTCLHRDYRGGAAMHRIWQGLAALVEERRIGLLFGLASFRGTDPEVVSGPLASLRRGHLAPKSLRPLSREPIEMDRTPGEAVDRRAAMLETPALVKAYLRLGGRVGEGAYLDRTFGCLDVCMVVDTAALSASARAIYARDRR